MRHYTIHLKSGGLIFVKAESFMIHHTVPEEYNRIAFYTIYDGMCELRLGMIQFIELTSLFGDTTIVYGERK